MALFFLSKTQPPHHLSLHNFHPLGVKSPVEILGRSASDQQPLLGSTSRTEGSYRRRKDGKVCLAGSHLTTYALPALTIGPLVRLAPPSLVTPRKWNPPPRRRLKIKGVRPATRSSVSRAQYAHIKTEVTHLNGSDTHVFPTPNYEEKRLSLTLPKLRGDCRRKAQSNLVTPHSLHRLHTTGCAGPDDPRQEDKVTGSVILFPDNEPCCDGRHQQPHQPLL